MRHIGTVFLLLTTVFLVWLFDGMRFKAVPLAPGRLLDPFHGFWQNIEGPTRKGPASLPVSGLKGKVTVGYDDRGVAHIFADNDADAYFAQGYVTARDRLWQMEFQIRAASGRLSEVVDDPRVLNLDRLRRRTGMVTAAETALATAAKDPEVMATFDAYTAGVNAYIDGLSYKQLPMEYKLLDYRPEPWTNLNTCVLLKLMAWDLTGRTEDFTQTSAHAALGAQQYAALFPELTDSTYPIIPRGTPWNFKPVRVDTPKADTPEAVLPQLNYPQPPAEHGSNNWAVSGKKTKKGYPILCNDPHLGLRLPSLWYEIQIVTPTQNVYGVSLPGAPGVIIGFNQDVAWGVTNASRDVLDWYKIKFKDATRSQYMHAGKWKTTYQRIEEIKIRGKAPLIDTVIYTHHGPLVYDRAFGDPDSTAPADIALRWAGADSSLEMKTIALLNRAKSHADYQAALKHFFCPGQNFIFISKSGDIAITQNGHFPAKWPGQGEYVMDGSDPLHDWQAYIPMDQNPHVLNPAQGFIMSTNQAAADASYPYNLAGSYDMTRNRRVQAALRGMKDITVEDMKKLQSDNYHVRAFECLPRMIALLDSSKLSATSRTALDSLKAWNYQNEPQKYAPSYYEYWENALLGLLWHDEAKAYGRPIATPTSYLSLHYALAQPTPAFVDDVTTPTKETIGELVTKALNQAMENLKEWEDREGHPQAWQYVNNVRVLHLLRRPSLSHDHIATGGNGGIVNANRQNSGASWRMIVELGPEPNAWGVYPGGQSGNPGNPHYDDGIPVWARGEYFKLHYLKSAADTKLFVFSQTFTPAQP